MSAPSLPSAAARRRLLREKAIALAVSAVGLSGIALVGLIFLFVALEALPLFTDPAQREVASWSRLFLPQPWREGRPPFFLWQPVGETPKFSMVPLLVGTLKVTLIAMLLAGPLGTAAALFSSQFAPRRVREVLKPVVELLAGVPSVVIGFFALMVLADGLQAALGLASRLNATVAGVGLAMAVVPVIFTVSEDALAAVPKSYREASLALGATRWETAWRVVLPAALPGVLAAWVLGMGRAIGETMIVLMASGNAAIVSWDPGDSARTLSATIAAEMGEVVVGSPHYHALFFLGVELFVITFLLNLAAGAWAKSAVQRLAGAGGR